MEFIKQFSECKNQDEARLIYRTLAKKYHPDLGGDKEAMQAINLAYESWTNKNCSMEESQLEAIITQTLQSLLKLNFPESVIIELIGTWIWVSGDTKPFKDAIKSLNFKWHCKRKMWFWHEGKTKRCFNKNAHIEEIKNKYGCKSFNKNFAVAV